MVAFGDMARGIRADFIYMHQRIGIINLICTQHLAATDLTRYQYAFMFLGPDVLAIASGTLVDVLLSMPKRARPIRDIVPLIELQQVQKTVTLALVRGWIGQDPDVCMSYRP